MANTTPKIETPTSADDLPKGLLDQQGMSPDEAQAGLFDALADDEEFADNENAAQSDLEDSDEEIEEEFEGENEDDLDDDLDDELEPEDEPEEAEESDEESEDLYEVTLPGGEKSMVTLDELRSGYSRTQDYTRKRQADAEEHRQAMTEAREIRERYADRLEKMQEVLERLGPQKPGTDLRQANPGEFAAQMAEWADYQESLTQVSNAKTEVESEQTAELVAAHEAHVRAEWGKTVELVPEWSNQQTAINELAELRTYAISDLGFKAHEIDSLADHRLLLMLKENYNLKQQRQKGKKVVETKRKASKRLQPGASNKSPSAAKKANRRRQQEADQLAVQSGSVKDAARAIEMLLDD
jgi:hypothetical protein